jgi:hypothetical protein
MKITIEVICTENIDVSNLISKILEGQEVIGFKILKEEI